MVTPYFSTQYRSFDPEKKLLERLFKLARRSVAYDVGILVDVRVDLGWKVMRLRERTGQVSLPALTLCPSCFQGQQFLASRT